MSLKGQGKTRAGRVGDAAHFLCADDAVLINPLLQRVLMRSL